MGIPCSWRAVPVAMHFTFRIQGMNWQRNGLFRAMSMKIKSVLVYPLAAAMRPQFNAFAQAAKKRWRMAGTH
ncbi:hypothetical protein KCP73_20180 [Salmonella enterica subsp. enterica]|nr:hypothetical protein KCP73_20180 [Salmonella enterica subsp. enterica]